MEDGEEVLDLDPGEVSGTMLGTFISGMAGGLPAALAFMAFNLLSVPCMAAVAAARSELQSRKKLWGAIGYWMGTAYIVSALIYWIGTYWWIGAILAGAIAVAVVAVLAVKKLGGQGAKKAGGKG